MPKEHGGDPIITGDDRRDPVRFHQQLENDRVHSLEDLTAVLQPFEERPRYSRQNMPKEDLETYLKQEENLHWGNPYYVFEDSGAYAYISFHYSPWLAESEDILLEGKVSFDYDIEEHLNEDDHDEIPVVHAEIERGIDGKDLYWVTVPTYETNPNNTFVGLDTLIPLTLEKLEADFQFEL